ncbi:molybdopterin cofactor-binding domain-containing protein [Colwellia sp. RE-S-Sl-9]
MSDSIKEISKSRRRFLKGSAASLVISMHLPMLLSNRAIANIKETKLTANAFIKISEDNTVTVLIKHIEVGQGAFTGLASLAADEMDASWSQIRAEHAPANIKLYANLSFGVQGTGGSTGLANSYMTMRKAGATAKQWLINAAAKKWQVNANEISVQNGIVSHPSGKQASFGDLVAIAATLSAPTEEPKLKNANQFTFIGKELPRLDTKGKTTGSSIYGLDIHKPNMITAVVAHPPAFGATVASFDATEAKKIEGVKDVKAIPFGIVVYANSTYNAIKGRRALKIEWDYSKAETRTSKELFKTFSTTVSKPGIQVTKKGNAEAAVTQADKKLEIELSFPYLAHAAMEPLNAVMQFKRGKVTAWFGSQIPTLDQGTIAKVFGIEPSKVDIQTQITGGSFGRRTQPDGSFAAEAAYVTKMADEGVPVKLVWTREDDIQGGHYRAMSVHKMAGALDEKGKIIGWKHSIAVQSIRKNSPFEAQIKNGIDESSVEGAEHIPYALPNIDVQLHNMETGVPVLWWRSVGHSHTGYAVETAIDLLLDMAEKDPIKGRLELMEENSREAQVLKHVANMAEKSGPVPKGRARGVAVVESFGSYVAEIAEISKDNNGMPKVHHVWCAVDCGIAVNPDIVKAQMQGGIGFGLDAALHGEIILGEKGKVEQSNFHNYTALRITEMPEIDIEILPSDAAPTGVGEPGTPPIAPAVSNAWRRLTGQYVTTLPFSKGTKLT